PGGAVPVGETTPQEAAAYRSFMRPTIHKRKVAPPITTPTTPTSPGKHHRKPHGKPHGKPHRQPATSIAGLIADTHDGTSQAALLGRAGMPVMYPKLILGASSYCFSITGNCDDGSEPAVEYAHSYPRAYRIHDRRNKPHAAYVMT